MRDSRKLIPQFRPEANPRAEFQGRKKKKSQSPFFLSPCFFVSLTDGCCSISELRKEGAGSFDGAARSRSFHLARRSNLMLGEPLWTRGCRSRAGDPQSPRRFSFAVGDASRTAIGFFSLIRCTPRYPPSWRRRDHERLSVSVCYFRSYRPKPRSSCAPEVQRECGGVRSNRALIADGGFAMMN